MTLGNSIRSGVKWLLVSNIGGQFLQFVFGIALARLLVPADFGMIVTIGAFTGFVGILASGGMGQALVRAKEATVSEFHVVFTVQFLVGIIIFATFWVFAPLVAKYFGNPLYSDLLRVSATSFVLRPFASVRIAWLNRDMDFKKRARIDLFAGLVGLTSSVIMAAAGMGVWSLAISGLVGALVTNILLSYVTPIQPRLRFNLGDARKLGAYGFKTTMNDFMGYLNQQAINLILSKMGGPAFLGLFNKAESLGRMPNRIITPPTGQVLFRAMSKVQENLDQTKYMFYRTITLLTVYIWPCLVGLWWVAEPFIESIYGPRWLPAAAPLRILVLVGLLRTINAPCWSVLAAQNRLTQEVFGQVLALIITVAGCLVGLRWGLIGVAWAMVTTEAFSTAFNFVLVYRTIPTRAADLFKAVAPALILNTILLAVIVVVHPFVVDLRSPTPLVYLAIIAIVGATVYVLSFLFFPIPALQSETIRWRDRTKGVVGFLSARLR